jgi:hypothetical protein
MRSKFKLHVDGLVHVCRHKEHTRHDLLDGAVRLGTLCDLWPFLSVKYQQYYGPSAARFEGYVSSVIEKISQRGSVTCLSCLSENAGRLTEWPVLGRSR